MKRIILLLILTVSFIANSNDELEKMPERNPYFIGSINTQDNKNDSLKLIDLTNDCWCTSVPGSTIEFEYSSEKEYIDRLFIKNGSSLDYYDYNRVKTLSIEFLSFTPEQGLFPSPEAEKKLVSRQVLEIKDSNNYQELIFKPVYYLRYSPTVRFPMFVRLTITEIYPGNKNNSTCISEISLNDKFKLRRGLNYIKSILSREGLALQLLKGPHPGDEVDYFKSRFKLLPVDNKQSGTVDEKNNLVMYYRIKYWSYPKGKIDLNKRIDIEETMQITGKYYKLNNNTIEIYCTAERKADKENPRRDTPLNIRDNCRVIIDIEKRKFHIKFDVIDYVHSQYQKGYIHLD